MMLRFFVLLLFFCFLLTFITEVHAGDDIDDGDSDPDDEEDESPRSFGDEDPYGDPYGSDPYGGGKPPSSIKDLSSTAEIKAFIEVCNLLLIIAVFNCNE